MDEKKHFNNGDQHKQQLLQEMKDDENREQQENEDTSPPIPRPSAPTYTYLGQHETEMFATRFELAAAKAERTAQIKLGAPTTALDRTRSTLAERIVAQEVADNRLPIVIERRIAAPDGTFVVDRCAFRELQTETHVMYPDSLLLDPCVLLQQPQSSNSSSSTSAT